MRNSHSHLQTLALTLGLGAAALFGACGGDDTGGGTGGAKGTGGGTGSGGTMATGGSTGSGGAPATGGSTGSGGATATGGTDGLGGTIATGGAIATGGTGAGSGGIDGSAGIDGAAGDAPIGIDGPAGVDGADDVPIGGDAPIGIDGPAGVDGSALDGSALDAPFAPRTLFDFANTSQGWVYGNWQARDVNHQPVAPFNLATAGIQIDGGAMPTIGWDGTVGDPAGSLRMTIDFSDWQQQVLPTVVFSAPLPNWTGRTITLRVKLAAVPAASLVNAGFVIYAQDDASVVSKQVLSELPADTNWHTLSLPIVADGGNSFDAASIKSLTVGVYSSNPPAAVDGGTVPAFTPAGVTVYVDSVALR